MFRSRLTLLSAVAAAVLAGGVMMANAEERRTEKAATSSRARPDGGAELRAALSYYRDLAEWRIRQQVEPSEVSGLERSLEVAAALITVRPGDALAAALADDAPVLRTRPVPGHANSNFGVRKNPFIHRGRERHAGIDLSASRNTPVHAAGAGMVVRAERGGGYGRVVYIDHGGGLETRYAHLQKILVAEGQFVPAGALIGKVGSSGRATGPHLHFEVRRGGRAVAPAEILGALLAPPEGMEWIDRMVSADRPEAPKSHRRRHRHHHRDHDRSLRSRRPAS
jgi:murein DD-endopeptidase MepM/ murein hydrolase activator NlpD